MAKPLIVGDDGDPCPRCHRPTQIREHVAITAKELRRPFYYSRWFYCTAADCETKMIMPERFMVFNNNEAAAAYRRHQAIWAQLKVPA